MKRRTFLIGTGGIAIGGSALLSSGAFSRVESQRDVTIEVAADPDAYLGLSGTGSANSDNYVSLDENGHLAIDIGENPSGGEGVNSDSFTWFESLVQVCNQGKEAVGFYIEPPGDDDFPEGIDATGPEGTPYEDEPRLLLYAGEAGSQGETNSVVGVENAVTIPVGECIELGLRAMTKGVDATAEGPLFGEDLTLVADVAVEGEEEEETPGEGGPGQELAVNADPTTELESQFDTLTGLVFDTNAVEICVEKAGASGDTEIGVQVTDHHGTFSETPTTWNPASWFLASTTIEFEDGVGCFTIGNPGVEALFSLFPFGGLESINDIENLTVAVGGEAPDAMFIKGVSASQGTDTATTRAGDTRPFDGYEADR